jgi:hypothetical protein
MTLDDILADLDDIKSALYDCKDLDENTCDRAQELLREVYAILEES